MSGNATNEFQKFEKLVETGKITSFSVSIQQDGLLITSEDGKTKQSIVLDSGTIASVKAYFQEDGSIQNDSYEYTSLKSLINTKSILDRMLHNGQQKNK